MVGRGLLQIGSDSTPPELEYFVRAVIVEIKYVPLEGLVRCGGRRIARPRSPPASVPSRMMVPRKIVLTTACGSVCPWRSRSSEASSCHTRNRWSYPRGVLREKWGSITGNRRVTDQPCHQRPRCVIRASSGTRESSWCRDDDITIRAMLPVRAWSPWAISGGASIRCPASSHKGRATCESESASASACAREDRLRGVAPPHERWTLVSLHSRSATVCGVVAEMSLHS